MVFVRRNTIIELICYVLLQVSYDDNRSTSRHRADQSGLRFGRNKIWRFVECMLSEFAKVFERKV